MIPNSAGTLLAFLGLVAPGVVFESLRQRRRPGVTRTTFQEASRIALASFTFTALSIAAVVLVSQLRLGLFADARQWSMNPDGYVADRPLLVAWTLLATAMLACGFAALSEILSAKGAKATIIDYHPWFIILRLRVPEAARPWVHVMMTDRTEFHGFVAEYSTASDPAERDLNLCGPRLQMQCKDAPNQMLDEWEFVSLRASEMAWIKVTYMAKDDSGIVRAVQVQDLPASNHVRVMLQTLRRISTLRARPSGVSRTINFTARGEGSSLDLLSRFGGACGARARRGDFG